MYNPQQHEETRLDVLHALMRAYPLGTWVMLGEGELLANHIPFALDPTRGEFGTLVGHVARANPIWKTARQSIPSTIIFQGHRRIFRRRGIRANTNTAKRFPRGITPWCMYKASRYSSMIATGCISSLANLLTSMKLHKNYLGKSTMRLAISPKNYCAKLSVWKFRFFASSENGKPIKIDQRATSSALSQDCWGKAISSRAQWPRWCSNTRGLNNDSIVVEATALASEPHENSLLTYHLWHVYHL